MDIQTKDGILLRNIPDGTPDEAIKARIAKIRGGSQATPAPDPSEGGLPLRPFGIDTGLAMPQGVSRFAAGAGKALTDIGRGAAQIVGGGPNNEEMAQIKAQDAPLMNTGAGMAGNITGNVAATLPTMAIPGVNSYTGAAALGGALGALQPTGEGDSRLANAGVGAGAGVVGQGLGNALSRLVRPVQSGLNPEQARLAQVALNEGIPINAADATGSKPLKITDSVLSNLPLTAGKQASREAGKATAFNKAALSRAGISADLATPDVLLAQKKALGSTFEDIASRNTLHFDQALTDRLAGIADDANQHLPPAAEQNIAGTVDRILSQVGAKDVMSGTNYQGWRTPLSQLAKNGDETSRYYGQIKRALDDAFGSQVTGADAQAWKDASRQYANLKTITDAMSGNAPGAVSGNIAPAQLGMALSRSVGKEGKALGRGDMNDLARAGNLFVRNQIPDSGTAQRQMIQSLLTRGALTGGGGAAAGGGIAAATGNDPVKGMMYGAGIGASSLIAPKLAQAILTNPAFEKYMINQAGSPTAKALAKLLQNSGRALGTTAAIPYMSQQ